VPGMAESLACHCLQWRCRWGGGTAAAALASLAGCMRVGNDCVHAQSPQRLKRSSQAARRSSLWRPPGSWACASARRLRSGPPQLRQRRQRAGRAGLRLQWALMCRMAGAVEADALCNLSGVAG
jgi:hypothetical protein